MNPTARLQTPRILWGALVFATLMIGALPWIAQHPDQTPNPIMLPALGGMSLVLAVLGLVFPEMQLKIGLARRLSGKIVERPNPAAEVTFREAAPPLKEFDDPSSAWTNALMVWQPAFIMKLALAESIAMFGLVLSMTGFPQTTSIPFTVLAATLQLVRFPTAEKLSRAVEKATGVPLPLS